MPDTTRPVQGHEQQKKTEKKIDKQVEDTFPASDPPSYAGGKHIVGAPTERKTPTEDIKPKPAKDSRN